MSFIFNRRVVKKTQNSKQDQIANHIFNAIIGFQQKWAVYLQNKTNELSKAVKIWLLIAFCVISVCYTINRLEYIFTTKRESVIHVESFLKLRTDNKSQYLIFLHQKQAQFDEYRRIQMFLNYMDSLNNTSSGRKLHDSILKDRPGLMDSIKHVERIFEPQINNK